ncbi:TadE family type IV pilus minor pilin [Actinotalea sp. C106]|uniref:TadE family type IV pilus minor pilin n=1 Tax=Actinotalea sp. C106 TaxID=2908644 RepID=UPI002027C11B|nr:TadE family type IV pilus minor pilin [Actinotalea sp. C106]
MSREAAARALAVRRAVGSRDRGAVTAELALALPAVILVLAVLLVTGAATSAQLRCADGARAGARAAALGMDDSEVAEIARQVTGGAAEVEITRADPWVEVRVSSAVAGGWFTGGPLGLSATATAWVEP